MPGAVGTAISFVVRSAAAVIGTGVGRSLFNAALGIGLSLAANALFRPSGQRQKLRPSDAQQQIRQPVPPRWKHYGQVRVAGPVFWFQADDVAGILYIGVAVNQGRISSFEDYLIDDLSVELDGSGNVVSPPYDTVTTRFLTRLGETPETAYTELSTAFGFDNVRGDGVASVLGIFEDFLTAEDQQKNYPNSLPRMRVTIKASVVWDFRDGTQSRTDESTWQWSENPVVCLMDYLLSPDGFGLSWDRIEGNLQEWIDAANNCDEQVWSAPDGVFENRYRVAGTYLFTDNPHEVVTRFLETMDGRLWQRRDGTMGIRAGVFRRPSITLGDDDVLSYSLERGEDRLTAVAGVRAQYMAPSRDYRETDAEPWPTGPAVAALSEDRVVNQDLTWCPSHGQARRMMQRIYLHANAKWRGQILTSLAGLRAIDERYIHLTIDELAIDDDFEVDHYSIDLEQMQVAIDLSSAIDPDDPVRPSSVTDDLSYAGAGVFLADNGQMVNVPLDLENVVDGRAPVPGDLVIFSLHTRDTSWTAPAGWTVIVNKTKNVVRYVDLFKIITQADLDLPAEPLTFLNSNALAVLHWFAFSPPLTGTPEVTGFADTDIGDSDRPPVDLDGALISEPYVLVSSHSVKNNNIPAATWSGATPDATQGDSNKFTQKVAGKVLVKVYPDGDGVEVTADAPDSGGENYQRIYAVRFI